MSGSRYKNIITYLLCFIVVCNSVAPVYASDSINSTTIDEAALLTHYPNARIIHVDVAAYQQLAEQLSRQGYTSTAAVPVMHLASVDEIINLPVAVHEQTVLPDNDCNKKSGKPTASDESVRVMVDFSSDMMTSGRNNRDTAAVVFVIIGTVLVVAWALYVFKYIYDVSTGFTPCGKWSDFAVISSAISSDESKHARFYGLRYMTGIREGTTEVGISAEIGNADILLGEVNISELKGLYWMIGPVLRWRITNSNNSSYFQMNFLAGSSKHEEIGVIAQTNLGVQFGIGNAMRLGVNWGAMNINLNNDQGIISDRKQYYYIYGVSMGYQF